MRPTQTWFMPKVPGRAIDPPGGACAHLEGDLHRHIVVPGPLEDLIPLADRVQRLATDDVDGADALTVVHGGFRDAVAGPAGGGAGPAGAGVCGRGVAVLENRPPQPGGRRRHRDALPYLAVGHQHVGLCEHDHIRIYEPGAAVVGLRPVELCVSHPPVVAEPDKHIAAVPMLDDAPQIGRAQWVITALSERDEHGDVHASSYCCPIAA